MPTEQTINIRPPVWLPIIVVLLGGLLFIGGKFVESYDPNPTLITVSGDGKVSGAPDIAEVSLGVQTGPMATSKAAMTTLETDMTKVLASIKGMGIEDKDIRTQQVSLNPIYDWTTGKQTLKGYEATQSVVVKVRDLDKVGDVISGASSHGANQVGGVTFTMDDPDRFRASARAEAIAEAKAKAQRLADDLGMRLGNVKGFSEDGGYDPPAPYMMRGFGDMTEKESLPVPEGEQDVTVTVTLTYELK